MQIRHDQAHNGFFAEITCTGRGQGLDKASFRTQRVANNVSHLSGRETRGWLSLRRTSSLTLLVKTKREDARLALSFWIFWVTSDLRKLKL